MATQHGKDWALVLGASSGFGAANVLELARTGLNIFGVHLDTRATLPNARAVQDEVQAMGREAVFFNTNAADPGKRQAILDQMAPHVVDGGGIRVLLHSLAFGTLKPFAAEEVDNQVNQKQMDMTLDVMSHSLVYWVQDLLLRGLLRRGSRVFAMTSAGSTRVWPTYGPVSAAKASLESHIRQLAFELAPKGIAVNGIKAGVTDTPALRKIPVMSGSSKEPRPGTLVVASPRRRMSRRRWPPSATKGPIGLQGTSSGSTAGRTWSGRTWSGRTWSGRTWSGRTWSGRTWSGRTWSGRTWSGRISPRHSSASGSRAHDGPLRPGRRVHCPVLLGDSSNSGAQATRGLKHDS